MSDQERKGTLYRFVTIGARTGRGGRISTGYAGTLAGLALACVGDFVEYPDGSRARIITGVGIPGSEQTRYAVVGSLLDNGDVINDSPDREPQTSTIFVPVDEHGVAIVRQ